MRAQARRAAHVEEEESAFVSMTDMTVGFLFIIMILLTFFASQINDAEVVPKERFESMRLERDRWEALATEREQMIVKLEAEKRALVDERDTLVLHLRTAQSALEVQIIKIRELQAELAEKDQKIKELEARISALEVDLERLRQEIKRLEAKLAELRAIDPLEEYLATVASARQKILMRLREAIKKDFPDLVVELSEESDALRFQGEGLFISGSSTLPEAKRAIVSRLAERLDEVLPCYTIGARSKFSQACNSSYVMIEAVQIEGHTDNSGSDRVNRNLSTARANETFFAMTKTAPSIMKHLNLKKQPVLSVAAYGPDRPVANNDTQTGRATNRRIDLRFIMVTPRNTSGIDAIREAFKGVGADIE